MAAFWQLAGGAWKKPGRPDIAPSVAPSVPGAPTGLAVTNTSNTSAGLAWTAAALPSGATAVTGFRIYIGGVAVATVGNVSSYSLTGLAAGTSYTVAVTALNSIGESALSNTVPFVTTNTAAVPNAPTNLTGSVLSDTSVSLAWTAATAPAGAPSITGYKVLVGSTVKATLGNVTTATITGLTAGTSYGFYVVAVNSNGQGAASSTRTLTTTNSSNTVITNLPAQPGLVAYGATSGTALSAYAHPGALVVASRSGYDSSTFQAISAAGGHVLIYLDVMVVNTTGRYHDLLFNASAYGPAVPKWPGPINANSTGDVADFRVGSVLFDKLPAILELMVAENPHMAGFFADDVGSRSYYPGFNWDTFGSTNQAAWRAGAIAVAQCFHDVAQKYGLITMLNGTWTAGTVASNGGGYPSLTTHGCSLAEGGCVEHHDGQIAYFGPYAGSTSQWGDACAIGHGKPFCFAIMATSAGVTEFKNDGRYAWIVLQTDYGTYPAPFTAFHPTGLASTTSG